MRRAACLLAVLLALGAVADAKLGDRLTQLKDITPENGGWAASCRQGAEACLGSLFWAVWGRDHRRKGPQAGSGRAARHAMPPELPLPASRRTRGTSLTQRGHPPPPSPPLAAVAKAIAEMRSSIQEEAQKAAQQFAANHPDGLIAKRLAAGSSPQRRLLAIGEVSGWGGGGWRVLATQGVGASWGSCGALRCGAGG